MQQPPYSPAPYAGGNVPMAPPTPDEKQFAMFSHFGNILATCVAPLIIYFMKKDQSKHVAFHALQSLYFSIAGVVIGTITCGLGFIAMWIFNVIAGMKAMNGEHYEYPVVGKIAREAVYGKTG